MVTPMLKVAGFDVVGAESVDEAWRHHDKGARFDAIVSDIEMPGTNGFEFAKRVRSDEHWKDTPIIAVSAIDDEDYQRRGREAGFIDYVPKSDGERLMAALSEATTHKSNGAGAKA
jgi:two-component system chemotaxis sensor kinase CheA